MKDGDLIFWGLVLWGLSQRARPGNQAPPPLSRNAADIGIGWWWYWFPSSASEQYQAALAKELRRATRRKEPRRWEVRKTIGGTSLGATVVVFYAREPFRWELPGLPMPAPRGLDTDLTDVASSIPEPPSELRRLATEIAQQTWEYLRELYFGQRPPREPL